MLFSSFQAGDDHLRIVCVNRAGRLFTHSHVIISAMEAYFYHRIIILKLLHSHFF